ncbi:uncharacterized protein LOC132607890 [Lycium barbarum]|uniref:uncharacterized protein LOC132607890 n=1 Tax=Lycium barbarum TaxID=112863 RepID=UPI00293E967B|nr:uncharacterized protein LOC132607890 [Lycium barbarum]
MKDDQLSVSINDKGIGSFPPERKEGNDLTVVQVEKDKGKHLVTQRKQSPLKELHDVISHNINVATEGAQIQGKGTFKENVDEYSIERVLNHVVKEVSISPKSMQKGNKKAKKQVVTDTQPTRRFRRRLGMRFAYHYCNGKIWFFVNDNVDIEGIQDSEQQITVKLFFHEWNRALMITMVYAKFDSLERISLWDSLYSLADQMDMPWLVRGDFNVIMNEDNKIGGLPVFLAEYEDFAVYINSYRMFANSSLQEWFGHTELEHFSRTGSDHDPLLLTCGDTSNHVSKPFRFLKFWTEHDSFLEVVNQGWNTDFEGDEFITFKLKLKSVKTALSGWSKETFGDIFKQLTVREDIVKRIQNHEGAWIDGGTLLADEAVRFYHHQFYQEGAQSDFSLLQHVPSMVTQEFNNQLISMPTLEDVKKAVFELSGESLSGPDGMIGSFYQVCWDIVGADVYHAVKDFFEGQTLPKSITHTNLVLLLKKDNIKTFVDTRPISLNDFINKVISRVVQDKLKVILPSLISPNQSCFVKERCIIENFLLTQEIVTDIRLRGKPANVVLKLNMEKAYDRVSWMFLVRVFRKMGLAEVFIDIVWRLIANTWYSVLLNGQEFVFFHSTRGVKQGDELSPALFILSAEVLSRALNSLFEYNGFRGYGMPKWSAKLNYLAYADDTIIFAYAEISL